MRAPVPPTRAWTLAFVAFLCAPAFATTADDVCPPAADPCTVSAAQTADPGSILDFGTRQLDVTTTVTIQAGGTASATGTVRADGADAGDIEIDALNGDITASGTYNAGASGTSTGDGGSVTLIASGNTTMSGTIAMDATGDSVNGGGD